METLLIISTLTLILICIGLAFLYKLNSEDIKELQKTIERLNAENNHIRIRLKIHEKKLIKLSEPSDKIEILHKYDDSDAPGYKDF